MKVRAVKEVYYAGRTRNPGDEFDCDDETAVRIWSAVDLPGGPTVEVVEAKQKPVTTRAMKAEEPPPPQPVIEEPQPPPEMMTEETRKRYYRRRDLKAEE